MEGDLLTAIFLVAVNLISNSLQISPVSDTITHKHVTYGRNVEGFAQNPEISQNTDVSSLPQLYRDALLKLNGTNYQELIKNTGSGGRSVKITFKRRVKGSHKNYAKATSHVSGYKTTDDSDPQNRETNFEGESFISKGHPKVMVVHHKNYITSVKLKKHAHKILPQDMTRTTFQSIYYDGNKHSASRNKGDNYRMKYIIKNNHIKKTPDMSQYLVDDSFPDTKNSETSSIHYIKPKNERSYSKSWHNVPSIKRTVKLTKHVMKTKTKVPVTKLKEADNGDIDEIYDDSEEPMENLTSENDNYGNPSSDEWVYEDIAAEKNNGNENSKDIPIDNIFYKGLVEAEDHQVNDLISEHKYPKVPAPSVKPPQGYQDIIFGDTSSTKDIDQDDVLKDDSSAKVKVLENNPNNVIVLGNDPYHVFVEDNTFSSDNPKYIMTDDVISEDINSKEKPIDVISKELSNNDQIPAEISSDGPEVFNVTPNNIESENDIVKNVTSDNLSNQEQSSEDVSDKADSEENTSSNTIKSIENISKIKNENTKNDLVNISDEHPDDSVKNIIWNRRPGKMIVYKKTSQHNVTKENIKLINYLRRKQMISSLKGERSGTATPVKRILDSRENPFLRDDFGENDSLKNANYENNDYNDLIPDVINVPYTKKSLAPWLVKLETIKKLVCHLCGTAKQLLHRKPDTFLINRMKQIYNELKILYSHLKDYVPKDSDSIEGGEDETSNIDLYGEDNNEDPGDIEKPIVIPISDYETWEKEKQKDPTGDVKNNLSLILKLLLKHDAQKDKPISDDSNESNKDFGNNLPVPLLKYWYNYLDGKTPKSNKDYNDSLLGPLIETIKNNPEVSPKANLKWYVKMNLRKILPVLQQNIITIRKVKTLIELLYKEFESTGKKDCQTDTYKKILKNIYNFLEFIMKLSDNRRN